MNVADLLPCTILLPSLGRAHRLREVVANIHEATPELHGILFCVGDEDSKAVLDELDEPYIDDSGADDKRYVTRMNEMVRYVNTPTVFFGSDDVLHHKGWLSAALRVMVQGPSVVVVNDLHNANGTQAVVRTSYLQRAVYDAPGDAFHGGYQHNFADNEMFFTAYKQGEYARAMGSFVEHLHPLFGSANSIDWDDTYTNAQHGWDADEERFLARAKAIESYFGGES